MGLFNTGLSVISGGTLGNNPVSRALGLSGEQGEYYHPETANAALDKYKGLANSYADDPNLAAGQVQKNPLLASLFGANGLQSRLDTEEQDLARNGDKMNADDYGAYGQASADIARQFGQQENEAAANLASRGLSNSGAAGATFSGLGGSKNEMLAKAQTDIAQKRIATNTQRLQNTRSLMAQLGQQADSAMSSAQHRQLDPLANAAGMTQQQLAMNNAAAQASLDDKRASKGQTLFDAAGQGLFSGVKQGVASRVGGAIGGPGASMGGGGGVGSGGTQWAGGGLSNSGSMVT